MRRNLIFALFFLLVIGFLIRIWHLSDNSLTFAYDQARDALIVDEILKGDFKVLGPPTSTNITYHGVLYYYIIAPGYLIGQGSPIIAAYWLAFLSSFGILLVYWLSFSLTKKIFTSLIAAVLFTVSFEASQYSTWLSNPSLAMLTVPLTFLGLWEWTKNKKPWAPALTALGLGLSIQADVFLLYLFIPVGIWLALNKKQVTKKSIVLAFLWGTLAVSTMLLAEIKFGFKSFSGMTELVSAKQGLSFQESLGDILVRSFNHLGRGFAYSIYPGNVGYGGLFVLGLVIATVIRWDKKSTSWEPFLLMWILSPLLIMSLGGGEKTGHIVVGIAPAVVILVAIFLSSWFKNQKILAVTIFLILVFANLQAIKKENKDGQTIFAIQRDMILRRQLEAIDYTYAQAEGKPFTINTLTSPLYVNVVWGHLYNWYGNQKYGYVPQWYGKDLIGQPAPLPNTEETTTRYYLIIEPMDGIPAQYYNYAVGEADTKSKLIEQKLFGSLEVQKREKI